MQRGVALVTPPYPAITQLNNHWFTLFAAHSATFKGKSRLINDVYWLKLAFLGPRNLFNAKKY
jgi:hypothetical protein